MQGVTTTTIVLYSSVDMRRLFLATRQEHDVVFPHNVRRSFGFRKTKPCVAGAALRTWVERIPGCIMIGMLLDYLRTVYWSPL